MILIKMNMFPKDILIKIIRIIKENTRNECFKNIDVNKMKRDKRILDMVLEFYKFTILKCCNYENCDEYDKQNNSVFSCSKHPVFKKQVLDLYKLTKKDLINLIPKIQEKVKKEVE